MCETRRNRPSAFRPEDVLFTSMPISTLCGDFHTKKPPRPAFSVK
jgi:hypothetical protein